MGDSVNKRIRRMLEDGKERLRQATKPPAGSKSLPSSRPQIDTIGAPRSAPQPGEGSKQLNPGSGSLRKKLFTEQKSGETNSEGNAPSEKDFPPLKSNPASKEDSKSEAHPEIIPSSPQENRDPISARTNAWTNRAFLSINRTRWKDNPYLEQVEPEWGRNVLDQEASVIAHTPESTPTRDEMERWLEWTAVNRLKLSIVQLRVINRQLFLVVMRNQEQRDKLLNISELSLDGFPVILSPWNIDFNHKKGTVKRSATWVELPGIDPIVEHLGNHMLSVLGQPTFRTVSKGVNRYSNMRGCVMMEEGAERPSKLVFQLPWGGILAQDVKYQDVPNACFNCKRPGHQARQCPLPKQGNNDTPAADNGKQNSAADDTKEESKASGSEAIPENPVPKEAEFIDVTSRRGKRAMNEVRSPNANQSGAKPFNALIDLQETSNEPKRDKETIPLESPSLDCSSISKPQNLVLEKVASVPTSDMHTTEDSQADVTSPRSDQLVSPQIKVPESAVDPWITSGEAIIGDWADVNDEDLDILDARGAKGRYEETQEHTPDRGNESKRRQKSSQAFSPRWNVQGNSVSQASQQGTSENMRDLYSSEQAMDDPDLGDSLPGAVGNPSGPDLGILDITEDRALGPTVFVDVDQIHGNGMGNPRKFRRLSKWLDTIDFSSSILALQETKIGGWQLKNRLLQINPQAQTFAASSNSGRARAIIMLDKSFQVDKVRDSVGPSPRVHGSEERVCNHIVQKRDFCDCYFEASSRSGPRYTRIARSGNRLDRSRLDRVYLTDSGKWLDTVASIHHFGKVIVGDHIPIRATLQLTKASDSQEGNNQSYFKLNSHVLHQSGMKERIREIWKDHPPECQDPRKRWSLAWARVRDFCQEQHKLQSNQETVLRLQKEVEERCRFLPADCSEEELNELTILEDALHEIENQEAALWYERSRSKWLREGEAPTKYFFNLAKAKFSRDRIAGVQLETREVVSRRQDILKAVEDYYTDLYNVEHEGLESRLAGQEILQLLNRGISPAEGERLNEMPSAEEVNSTVKTLKRGKAPGLDGLTNDMIIDCWDFIREECVEMVRSFWTRKSLLHKDSRGCIKLLAKNDERHLIKNWRPITLMSCTYKLISKLIANRLKPLLPNLIDTEQSGFVPGRKIDNNILTLRLAEEWGKMSGETNLFVKLDFTKAFDRISFTFLWHTLRKMGFLEDFICRIRGLMTGGSSQVHVNQAFTASFKIKRGVRQGCPLAPLLFALSTQPLMRVLRKEEEDGSLQGLQIPGMRSIIHELFADDTSLFIEATARDFQRARSCIEKFERASGASLNVQKSMVMALGNPRQLGWLRDSGCLIAGPRRRFKYLGVWSGRGVTQQEVTEVIVNSIEKKVKLWLNRFLSFPSKLLLSKHVLSAIPSHHLLTVGLDAKGLARVNRALRNFLWGFAEGGKPKQPLIAWTKLHLPKDRRGLGWTDLHSRMKSSLARKAMRFLNPAEEQVGWMRLATAIVAKHLAHTNKADWSIQEVLLLSNSIQIRKAPTLSRILSSWFAVRKYLSIQAEALQLPATFTYAKVEALLSRSPSFPSRYATQARKWARRLRWRSISDMQTEEGNWKSVEQELLKLSWFPEEEDIEIMSEAWKLIWASSTTNLPIEDMRAWKWTQSNELPDYRAVGRRDITDWIIRDNTAGVLQSDIGEARTSSFWNKLWSSDAAFKCKIEIWRATHHGFFSNSRAIKMGFGDGLCKRCIAQLDSPAHMFWTCPRLQNRTRILTNFVSSQTVPGLPTPGSIEDLVEQSLVSPSIVTAIIFTAAEWIKTVWKERNALQYSNKRSYVPILVIIEAALRSLTQYKRSVGNEARRKLLQDSRRLLQRWIDSLQHITCSSENTSFLSSSESTRTTTTPSHGRFSPQSVPTAYARTPQTRGSDTSSRPAPVVPVT
ncbi:hypothetical protein R1sor_014295 [Riccia sorocarpa]|uniref:Reverse transcriptase domain-containing protein n=1 Tax=Riccia sorocarpa TaxID=122646 RepID=A0ABD3HD62_9MARC